MRTEVEHCQRADAFCEWRAIQPKQAGPKAPLNEMATSCTSGSRNWSTPRRLSLMAGSMLLLASGSAGTAADSHSWPGMFCQGAGLNSTRSVGMRLGRVRSDSLVSAFSIEWSASGFIQAIRHSGGFFAGRSVRGLSLVNLPVLS